MNVRELLLEAGYGPWLSFPAYRQSVALAEAISLKIVLPIERMKFVVEAAGDLSDRGPGPTRIQEIIDGQGVDDPVSLVLRVEAIDATPLGPTELWGAYVGQFDTVFLT
jgi:hypothetical protein